MRFMRLMGLRTGLLLALLALILLAVTIQSRRLAAPPTCERSAIAERVGPRWAYPDSAQTPGATNPDITQENIHETICNPDWSTRTIRPPASYTTRLKKEQIQYLGLAGSTADYEEDHLISLELGGHPTDPRNLWPEPYSASAGAREKDLVENYLHRQVCTGTITLRQAQTTIASDWYAIYLKIHR
jgi:hypothetical protein